MKRSSWPLLLVVALVLAGAGLRVAAALRPGLWADEIFSLALATGHSLEHSAAKANPKLGDYVEPREAQLPAAFDRYTRHEQPPAGIRRVTRAVLLSDTNPPLYYLLLNRWTRLFGTSDAALRLFSVWWAVLTLPLLWLLGRELGSRRVAWTACLLFSVSPVAIYYSTEGRMYALVGFLAAALAWLTLQLSHRQRRPWLAALWGLVGVAGLLTHYFFAFVWLACAAWLWLYGRRIPRRRIAALAGITLLAVLPWYIEVPASLAHWRISGNWLDGELAWRHALTRPLALTASLLAGKNDLGGWRWANKVTMGLFGLLAVWILWQRSCPRISSRRARLLWACVGAASAGPLVFDVLRHTTTSDIPRYALAGLPAAVLLAALAVTRLPPKLHLVMLGALVLAWFRADQAMLSTPPRPWQPYREVGTLVESWARPGDLVVVHSIPSGVIGVARYLTRDVPLASWVVQLDTRKVPADLELLLRGRRRVAVVRIHQVGAPPVAELWLRDHARLLARDTFHLSRAEVLYFAPAHGGTFFPEAAPVVSGTTARP